MMMMTFSLPSTTTEHPQPGVLHRCLIQGRGSFRMIERAAVIFSSTGFAKSTDFKGILSQVEKKATRVHSNQAWRECVIVGNGGKNDTQLASKHDAQVGPRQDAVDSGLGKPLCCS
jgi:hypothetical protein